MRIIVDENIPAVRDTFARLGHVFKANGRNIGRGLLRDADALIVRSVTPVNAALLEDTRVEFVGTATIGTDHIDTDYLDEAGIRWASAPGCNADAAAQYSLAMMMLACGRIGKDLNGCTVGIVGRGNVGGRLLKLLTALGVRATACDPPLADAGETDLCEMEDILDCDIVSLHVPLTRAGPYPTFQMIGGGELAGLRAGSLLINTSRGNVVDGPALAQWLASGRGFVGLDVWPEEPRIDPHLLDLTTVATPHVAGYSLDGKYRGTEMIYTAYCKWLRVAADAVKALAEGENTLPDHIGTVADAVLHACPVRRDDAAMRSLRAIDPDLIPEAFDALRRDYPKRRDFAGWRVPDDLDAATRRLLLGLGFAQSAHK